jgi:hypothetical protein
MSTYLVLALVVVAIVGGIFGGGIFTIVLIPLAVIAFLSTVGYGLVARAAGAGEENTRAAHKQRRTDFQRHRQGSSGRVPTSPEGLTDARRQQQ